MPAVDHLAALADRATAGDATALNELMRELQGFVYNLAMRMLWHPQDAEDATQEILLRIVTRLDQYRGESAFATWAYRVAANHLLTTRKRRAERQALTPTGFAVDLSVGAADPAADLDADLLAEEVKIGCTHAMLLMLDREHRLAYILGDVFDLDGQTAAAVSSVKPATHRQRLARARSRIRGFMAAHCGLVNETADCRCERRITPAIQAGRVDPESPLFARHPRRRDIVAATRDMESLHSAAAIFRAEPDWLAPATVTAFLDSLIQQRRLPLLDTDATRPADPRVVGSANRPGTPTCRHESPPDVARHRRAT